MPPPNGRSPAADPISGKASGESVTAAKRNLSPDKAPEGNCKRSPQVRCAMCGKPSDKRNGRRRLYCSDACRMAAHRIRAGSHGSHDPSVIPLRNGLKNPDDSIGCEAPKRDPHPSQFDVPLNILGGGYRWPGAPQLDRETRERILCREGCAP